MTDEVKRWGTSGAILVKVEFLDAHGAVEEAHPERVVTDFRLTPTKFAFLTMEQERPDAIEVTGFEPGEHGWILESDRKRLTITPVTDKKLLKTVKEWKASVEYPEAAAEELEALFNEM